MNREARGDVPGPVRDYLLQRPAGPSKIDLGSHAQPVQFGQFRGLGDFAVNSAAMEPESPIEIVITAWGAVSDSHREVTVRFALGTDRKKFIFVWPKLVTAQIRLPVPADLTGQAVLRIELEIESPLSPHEQTNGKSPDRRQLGVGIKSLAVRPAPGADTPSSAMLVQPEASNQRRGPLFSPHPELPAIPDTADSRPRSAGRIIAMTMVYNEGDMLRRWLAHYGRHLGEQSLLIIDHGSDDGSTDNLGAAGRIILPRGPFDDGHRTDFINSLQRNLFQYYDTVIYTDCDEFLVPDPRKFSSLASYVEQMTADCVRAVGFNLLHIRGQEDPLRADRGFLDQRGYCRFYTPECKPLITRTPLVWQAGFHCCDKKALLDSGLLLIHAKLADYTAAMARLALTREMPWTDRALRSWGAHQRTADEILLGGFDTQEQLLRQAASVDTLCPTALAEMINAQLEASANPLRCEPYNGPVCRIPEWLRGAV
jgi:hypothetical protein